MLVCGDVVYAQIWQVLTLKNCLEPLSYASTAYFVAWLYFPFDCFVKIWATCKNFLGKWTTAPPVKKLPVRLWFIGVFIKTTNATAIRARTVLKGG